MRLVLGSYTLGRGRSAGLFMNAEAMPGFMNLHEYTPSPGMNEMTGIASAFMETTSSHLNARLRLRSRMICGQLVVGDG